MTRFIHGTNDSGFDLASLHDLLDGAELGLVQTDRTTPNGIIRYVSSVALTHLGYASPDELVGRDSSVIWSGAHHRPTFETLMSRGPVANRAVHLTARNDAQVPTRLTARARVDAHGNFLGLDIIWRLTGPIEDLLNKTRHHVVRLSDDGVIQAVDLNWQSEIGMSEVASVGCRFADVIHDDDSSGFGAILSSSSEEHARFRYRLRRSTEPTSVGYEAIVSRVSNDSEHQQLVLLSRRLDPEWRAQSNNVTNFLDRVRAETDCASAELWAPTNFGRIVDPSESRTREVCKAAGAYSDAQARATPGWAADIIARTSRATPVGTVARPTPADRHIVALPMNLDRHPSPMFLVLASKPKKEFGRLPFHHIDELGSLYHDECLRARLNVMENLTRHKLPRGSIVDADELASCIGKHLRLQACSIFTQRPGQGLALAGSFTSDDVAASKTTQLNHGQIDAELKLPTTPEHTQGFRETTFGRHVELNPRDVVSVVSVPLFGPDKRPLGLVRCMNRQSHVPAREVIVFSHADIETILRACEVIRLLMVVTTMVAKETELTRHLVHEFKNPLSAASGIVDALEFFIAERQRHRIHEVVAELGTTLLAMNITVDSHRDMVLGNMDLNLSSVELERDILPICHKILEREFRHTSYRLEDCLRCTLEGLPPLWIDKHRMLMVFINLLRNSLKYTRPGKPPDIQIKSHKDQLGRIIIQFIDRGIGIPKQESETVFKKNQRGSKAARYASGMGLGLYISRKTIEAHEGELVLTSVGRPTTFEIRLPSDVAEPRSRK